jgi:para-aminobenzoate synthetase component 1
MEILNSKSETVPAGTLLVTSFHLEPSPKPEDVFRTLTPSQSPTWLDPSDPKHLASRYSFVAWDPWGSLGWRDGEASWHPTTPGERPTPLGEDPFEALRSVLGGWRLEWDGWTGESLPFAGGAVGYFAYELGRCLEKLPESPPDDLGFPGLHMFFYNVVYAYDHSKERGVLCVGQLEADPDRTGGSYVRRVRDRLLRSLSAEPARASRRAKSVNTSAIHPQCDTSHADYLKMVQAGRDYIARGDIFQVNLSQRFTWPVTIPPNDLYFRLRAEHPAPFSAYLSVDSQRAVLSVSPELYLRVRGRDVMTNPIKGTRPRFADPELDEMSRRELLASEKDRAELVMIVDLERNDLGRVCEFGSVKVNELAGLESFATVHHLVAEVEGKLRPECDLIDLIRASFPGGSVTGAPKIRAMEIIAELERTARSLYTGSVGWIGLDGNTDLNIAIRTVLYSGSRAAYRVGGAVVTDSDPQGEYEETLHKGRALHETLSRH